MDGTSAAWTGYGPIPLDEQEAVCTRGSRVCRRFPDDFLFDCDRAQVQRMLGNAVPSLLAEVLAREIRRQLLDAPLREQKLELMPPRRRSVPRRHAAAPVRSVYLSLKGAHPDHPGTALGPRARLRSVELSS